MTSESRITALKVKLFDGGNSLGDSSGNLQLQSKAIYEVLLAELVTGAAPVTPASGKVRLYAKGDKQLYYKDDTGLETGPLGSGGGGGTHNLLSATHPDTTAAAVLRGALILGQGASPKWALKGLGSSGQFLVSDGTDLIYRALIAGDIPDLSAIYSLVGHGHAQLHDRGHTMASASDHTDWPAGLTVTELAYLDGVTSAIQTQLDGKAPIPHGTSQHSGNVLPGANQNLGGYYLDISQSAAPADPSTGIRRLFVDSSDGKLKVRTSAGNSVSLEEQAGTVWSVLGGEPSSDLSTSATQYMFPVGSIGLQTTDNELFRWRVPVSGTVKRLYLKLNNAPGTGTSRTFTFRKGGTNQSVTVTISDTATTGEDTTHSFVITAGDSVNIESTMTGTPAAGRPSISFVIENPTS